MIYFQPFLISRQYDLIPATYGLNDLILANSGLYDLK